MNVDRMINAINAVYPTGNLLLDVIFSEFTIYKSYLLKCADKHSPDYLEQEDIASTYSCNPLGLQASSAYSRGFSCASRYRYAISSGVSSKTDELHFSQLIVRGVSEYV